MRLIKTLIVLVGILLQAIVAMVFFEGHRAFSIEPMQWWFPWTAYSVGGIVSAAFCLWGYYAIQRKVFLRKSSSMANVTIEIITQTGAKSTIPRKTIFSDAKGNVFMTDQSIHIIGKGKVQAKEAK